MTGNWENEIVTNVIKVMNLMKITTFLGKMKMMKIWWLIVCSLSDIGANIGVYSLAVAARNLNVVAVDSESDNLAFIKKSAELMNKRKYVRFINNAVRSDWLFTFYNTRLSLYICLVTSTGSCLPGGGQPIQEWQLWWQKRTWKTWATWLS